MTLTETLLTAREVKRRLTLELTPLKSKIDELSGEIVELENQLIEQHGAGFNEATELGSIKTVWRSRSEVIDLAVFHSHIIATNSLDLLQNRPSDAGIRARWDSGFDVPGVKRNDYLAISYSNK